MWSSQSPDGVEAFLSSWKSAFGWMFRSRQTGRIVVAQVPNAPLLAWLAAVVVLRVADPSGRVRTAVDAVGTLALAVWAVDEVARGVNPWRRVLGGAVLGALIVSLLR